MRRQLSTAVALLVMTAVARLEAQAADPLCGPVVKLSAGVMRNHLLRQVQPQFGPIIRQTGVSGQVVFKAVVGCDGRVQSVMLLSGPDAFRLATVDAVKQWVYQPYMVDDKALPFEITQGIIEDFGADVLYEQLPSGRIRVSSGVMAGRILSKSNPTFAPFPAGTHFSGATVLAAVIGRDGSVVELKAIFGPEILRQQVMDSVWQWRYRPFLVNGEPVEVETTIHLNIDFGG